ncbi:antitoxin Xre/MbcA/ParS toxin-binding domain-containing protein [Arcicella sp. LKC2W]|jgi:putative toxin-antitoxin system antitoxin component (TIGR02293 family)|uniref:type II RES/Xre toxin-antitoxin system antitoxin n=1 Tax=Arcicella sp. LKC2W TaxID=2984198 RepID=UPI002B219E6A|nr:antitoxin Xre/MbcA/ParS toxin-binding domain-containing protein [Arcicella sp. LKC2W]MEA5458446.1 antitoxin Xre/MbcA/ParS toxin-binding domain-containing protein [Arcicella sp. LKC2W]
MEVQEEAAIYAKYAPQIRGNISIVLNARKGLSASILYDIILLTGFKKEQIATLFNTSAKTITRYTQEGKNLDVVNSEHALKLIALFKKGNEIFGELEAFRKWIMKPAYGLGWEIPAELMETSGGIELIMEELYRIEFGATA